MPTITVGIPAYNEQHNIQPLLRNICNQKSNSFRINEIIVIADGCTDETVAEVNAVIDPRIRLIELSNRSGLAHGQNLISQNAESDILILLDADVLPTRNDFIHTLALPLTKDSSIGIVGAAVDAVNGNTFFEKVIAASEGMKLQMYKKINSGDTVYLCHGRARAFSKEMYKELEWPDEYAEDAFSYFFCKKIGLKFYYESQARVQFRSPSHFTDHRKQSLRFFQGKKNMENQFDAKTVSHSYKIPKGIALSTIAASILKRPILISTYLAVVGTIWIEGLYKNPMNDHSRYEPSSSSKSVKI